MLRRLAQINKVLAPDNKRRVSRVTKFRKVVEAWNEQIERKGREKVAKRRAGIKVMSDTDDRKAVIVSVLES